MDNPYEILGIPKRSSKKTIDEAYKKLIKKVHPDKGGSKYLFQKVNQAYKELTEEKNKTKSKKTPNSKNKMNTKNKTHNKNIINQTPEKLDKNLKLLTFPLNSIIQTDVKPEKYYSKSMFHSNINGIKKTKIYEDINGKKTVFEY